MKIGLIIYGSLQTMSGGFLYDRKLVENLTAFGDEITVVSIPWKKYPLNLLDNFSSPLRDRLLKSGFDVLLEDELNHPSLFLLNGWLHTKTKIPIIGIVHHLRINEKHSKLLLPVYRVIEKKYLTSLDGVICNSKTTRQSVENLLSRKINHVVAYPAADHFEKGFSAPEDQDRRESGLPLRILFIGNLIPRKGLHVLIQALSLMREARWELTVVGSKDFEPAYAKDVIKLAGRLLPSAKVNFIGALTDEELLRTYQKNDLLVVPSSYEGFGIVYLEAMQLGLAPVGTTGGAAGEIITDQVNGFLVPPDDPAALSTVLRRLISNPQDLRQIQKNASQRAREFPSWRQSAELSRDFLIEMIKSRNGNVDNNNRKEGALI